MTVATYLVLLLFSLALLRIGLRLLGTALLGLFPVHFHLLGLLALLLGAGLGLRRAGLTLLLGRSRCRAATTAGRLAVLAGRGRSGSGCAILGLLGSSGRGGGGGSLVLFAVGRRRRGGRRLGRRRRGRGRLARGALLCAGTGTGGARLLGRLGRTRARDARLRESRGWIEFAFGTGEKEICTLLFRTILRVCLRKYNFIRWAMLLGEFLCVGYGAALGHVFSSESHIFNGKKRAFFYFLTSVDLKYEDERGGRVEQIAIYS